MTMRLLLPTTHVILARITADDVSELKKRGVKLLNG